MSFTLGEVAQASEQNDSRIAKSAQFSMDLAAILLLFVIEGLALIWTSFDHSSPCWDTAAHRINSSIVFELMSHPHLGSVDWYRGIFAVSPLYPPFFYMVSASLKFVMGEFAQTERTSNFLFTALLFCSVYYIARITCRTRLACLLAPLILFLYPLVFWTTHTVMLECGTLAMVGLSLGAFFWWASGPRPIRSIIVGIIFGLTVLTKNNSVLFLVGPVALDAGLAFYKRDKQRIFQLLLTGVTSAAVILPWILLAGSSVTNYINTIQAQNLTAGDKHVPIADFLQNLSSFVVPDLATIMTPLLYGCSIIALLAERRHFNRIKLYLFISAIVGIVLASSFRWLHSSRYVYPATIPLAIFTAEMLADNWLVATVWKRVCISAVGVLAAVQLLYSSFTPYPIHPPAWFDKAMNAIGVTNIFLSTDFADPQGLSQHPWPDEDWCTTWALSIIEKEGDCRNKAVSLVVMPSSPNLTLSTYIYQARLRKDNIRAVDCRNYTVLGDRTHFDKEVADSIDWYVLKTGDQGRVFTEPTSQQEFQRWCNYIRTSKRFQLKDTHSLPDGSLIQLYQAIHS